MSKRVLVTGGSGFIGSHIVDQLTSKNYKVTVVDRINSKRQGINLIKTKNLSLKNLIKITKNIDYVFHLAAVSNIDKVKSIPLHTIENNIMVSANLLEACRINSVKKILFASSIYAHGISGNLYTSSKIASELIISNYKTLFDLNYTILRFSTAFGERNRGADVLSIFIHKAMKNLDLEIHGDGKQTRNFINVKDLAFASVAALNMKYNNKILTIGTSKKTTILDLAKKIIKLTKSKSKIVIKKGKKRLDDFNLSKISKIPSKNLFKFKTIYDLDSGIKSYIKSLKI